MKTRLNWLIELFHLLVWLKHFTTAMVHWRSGEKIENNMWNLIKSQWCKGFIQLLVQITSSVTWWLAHTATSKKGMRGTTFTLFKRQYRLHETGDTSSKQGRHFPQREKLAVYNTQKWTCRTQAHSTSGHFPAAFTPAVWHHRQGEGRRLPNTPNYEWTKAEKGRMRQRKSVEAERGLSDSFPWQDDKIVWNAMERGKRCDQELNNEKRGKNRWQTRGKKLTE